MDGRLRGKKAICTAAGQGIGRAVAVAFASEGAHVVASDVDPGKLAGLDDSGIAEAAVLDVTSAEAVASFARGAPAPDILFNCAGSGRCWTSALHSAMMAGEKVRTRLPELERDVAHMCIKPVKAVREIIALMGLADRDQ